MNRVAAATRTKVLFGGCATSLLLAFALPVAVAGVSNMAPQDGQENSLQSTLNFAVTLAPGVVCDLDSVAIDFVAIPSEGASRLEIQSEGFEVSELSGAGLCDELSSVAGLPSDQSTLFLDFRRSVAEPSSSRESIHFTLQYGQITIGDRFTAQLPAGGGTIMGTRSLLSGEVDAALTFDDFEGTLDLNDQGQTVVVVSSEPAAITGTVPAGKGPLMIGLAGTSAALGLFVGTATFVGVRRSTSKSVLA